MNKTAISDLLVANFARDGYVVVPGLADNALREQCLDVAKAHLAEHLAPMEYEVDVQYPGAPVSHEADGAQTSRRLLQAYSRHGVFRQWGACDEVAAVLKRLFSDEHVALSQCHHNCIMTKQPGYSSATLWHQDNRYWSFDQENLVSVWLALGAETRRNGCLRVIPGSHRIDIEPGRFDAARFLRPDLPENKSLLSGAVQVPLEAGDTLFFHSRLFHAAGRNLTDETKFSLVYTYHQTGNHPIAGTRSARFPSIEI